MRHFISTDAVVIVGIDMKNEATNVLILLDSWRRRRIKVLIVGTAVDVKDPAYGFDVMLEAQLMDGI